MNKKLWVIEETLPAEVGQALGAFHPLVGQLLYNRQVRDAEAARLFFDGQSAQPEDPLLLTGMAEAVDRVRRAIRSGERIVVYGDYDTDGVTATVLLVQTLSALAADVQRYIPDREEEGYGLNGEALGKIRNEIGGRLVITVDCGVRALAEAETARELGLELIITDHHEPGSELPRAFAIINPRQPGDPYPEKDLAGVGLAYKLAQGLIRPMVPRPTTITGSDVLDLVALGTVADMVPLKGENRYLVRQGLTAINRAKRQGLKALLQVARVTAGKVDSTTIGFALGPRLNAAGRLESALDAFELLSTGDPARAGELAQQLEAQNRERQVLTREAHGRAREIALASGGSGVFLFAADESFREGVVGLAAARLTEEFYRPAAVVHRAADKSKGSARSIPEFHITRALDECRSLLDRHGGHKAAAGFTLSTGKLGALAEQLEQIAVRELGDMELRPTLRVDADGVKLADLTPELLAQLQKFEPCGYGNPAPVLASRGLRVNDWRTVGADGKHLKLSLTDGSMNQEAIAFGQAVQWVKEPAHTVDIAYTVEWNEWNGQRRVQLNVKSIEDSRM